MTAAATPVVAVRLERIVSWTAVAFIAAMASFVQSFVLLKLALLLLFVTMALLSAYQRGSLTVHPRLVGFYLALATVGAVWAVMSLVRGPSHMAGVTDAVRLYVVWSMAFVGLYTLVRSTRSSGLREVHHAFVIAGIVIALLNLAGLADTVLQAGVFGEEIRKELDMFIAVHSGYVQITSQNIGALFLVVPYLLTLQFRTDASGLNTRVTKVALVLSLVIAALSGRRALWLVVALTPATIFAISLLTRGFGAVPRWGQRLLITHAVAGVLGASLLVAIPTNSQEFGFLSHLKAAFSAQDERSIQAPFLLHAFAESPALGAGFGATTAYVRSYEQPWAGYELTYHQMLFNLGAIGFGLLLALFATYFGLAVRTLRRAGRGTAVSFGLLVAFCSLLMGAVTNRYFGSFDFLFFVGLLPFVSTQGDLRVASLTDL